MVGSTSSAAAMVWLYSKFSKYGAGEQWDVDGHSRDEESDDFGWGEISRICETFQNSVNGIYTKIIISLPALQGWRDMECIPKGSGTVLSGAG